MKVLAVVGPADAGTTALVQRLVDRLGERGRVGTVTHARAESSVDDAGGTPDRRGPPAADRTYTIGDGHWIATGEDRTLSDALDDLATDCEYAVVESDTHVDLPTIALGDGALGAAGDEVLLSAPSADEVALDDAVGAIESTDHHESLASLVAAVKRSPDGDRAGAIATFTGRVRERDGPDDDPTEFLEFERYDGVAGERMATIREDLEAREGVYAVALHHRTGVVEAGEDIVFVVILAGHRAQAFRAVQDGIDRLKEEVPLFKREVTVDGEFWAHEH